MAPPLCQAAVQPGGVSTAINRVLSVLLSHASQESGKVQVATIAARVKIWAGSNSMEAYPDLAVTRAAPPHHARHKLRFGLQMVYMRAG
jgi:hypothetical protein